MSSSCHFGRKISSLFLSMADRRALQAALQERYGNQDALSSATSAAEATTVAFARKKREHMRRSAVAASSSVPSEDEDGYIPLTGSRPQHTRRHESRLPREENELDNGEDEHAQYTAASERIALGPSAERQRKLDRRRHLRSFLASAKSGADANDASRIRNTNSDDVDDIEIIVRRPRATAKSVQPSPAQIHEEDAFAMSEDAMSMYRAADVSGASNAINVMSSSRAAMDVDDMDEDESEAQEAWEQAQMRRVHVAHDTPSEGSPTTKSEEAHVPAAVPLVSALPTPNSCITRLELRLVHLEQSASDHQQHAEDTQTALRTLAEEESTLKVEADALERKAAWFTDMKKYVDALASFLDTKMPMLETLEHNALALLVDRCLTRQRARALAWEDDIALVHGASAASLWIARPGTSGELRRLDSDGAWNSAIRADRRRRVQEGVMDSSAQWLDDDEKAHFNDGHKQLCLEHEQVMKDVQALAFRAPDACVPDSMVSRFDVWRKTFPDEYNMAWGGLALANAWEFYARYELVLWDALWCPTTSAGDVCLGGSPEGIPGFAWEQAVSKYVEDAGRAGSANHCDEEGTVQGVSSSGTGGDDEITSTLVAKTVVPKLMALAQNGAYDPFSAAETQAALDVIEQVSYVLEPTHWQFQALVQAFRTAMTPHVRALANALRATPTYPGAPMHPDGPPAWVRLVKAIATLTCHIFRWSTYWVGPHALPWNDASEVAEMEALATEAVTCAWSQIEQAAALQPVADIAQTLLHVWPTTVAIDLRHACEAYVQTVRR